MGMCKKCGEVFNTIDMKSGYCKNCFTPEIAEQEKKLEEMKNQALSDKRPTAVTIASILSFLSSFVILSLLLMPSSKNQLIFQFGEGVLPILILSVILSFIGAIGYWKMYKWGVYAYSAMIILNIGSNSFYNTQVSIQNYIMPIIIIIIGIVFYKKMK